LDECGCPGGTFGVLCRIVKDFMGLCKLKKDYINRGALGYKGGVNLSGLFNGGGGGGGGGGFGGGKFKFPHMPNMKFPGFGGRGGISFPDPRRRRSKPPEPTILGLKEGMKNGWSKSASILPSIKNKIKKMIKKKKK